MSNKGNCLTQKFTNPFPFSDNNKRYHTLNYYNKQKFGGKVIKISLNGGFTCPNIDGTVGKGGCTYCSNAGSGDFAGNPNKPITAQFAEIKEIMGHKWSEGKYIAYFQAFTNTYAPIEILREKYEEALGQENVVGLTIATRADAIADDVLDYLEELSHRTNLVVELGLQSIFNSTGERINRGHTFLQFQQAVERLKLRNINVCVHIINGLPDETHNMMVETAKKIATMGLHSIKIHSLHIIKGTKIADEYENGEFKMITFDEYVSTVCDQLEYLPKEIVVERLTGDGIKSTLIAPIWSLDKKVVINAIDKELFRRNSYQGIKHILL
ncbi:MAG: TIGR01212 family radical SAM protein [Oscillospiraceae bacterium]